MELIKYRNEVLDYLEYLQFPELVIEFEPDCVAKSVANSMIQFYYDGISPRMAAIIIWSLTMTMQVIPAARNSIQH